MLCLQIQSQTSQQTVLFHHSCINTVSYRSTPAMILLPSLGSVLGPLSLRTESASGPNSFLSYTLTAQYYTPLQLTPYLNHDHILYFASKKQPKF